MTLIESLKRIGDKSAGANLIPDAEVPCKETSDRAMLCKNPVVSIVMITYNHEKYIREAIESVLSQKTDFEYELILGEDCSTDKTREICFEYQARYPEKVRVLWADENVYKINGNERRCIHHARGEYLAFCEGDDYWTDPQKLQKQVELIKKTGSVGSVAFNDILSPNGGVKDSIYDEKTFISEEDVNRHYFHTSTFVFEKKSFYTMLAQTDYPHTYSSSLLYGMLSLGKVCLLSEIVSVYRITGEGEATSLSSLGSYLLSLRAALQLVFCLNRPSVVDHQRKVAQLAICQILRLRGVEAAEYKRGRVKDLLKVFVRVSTLKRSIMRSTFDRYNIKIFLSLAIMMALRIVPNERIGVDNAEREMS